METLSNEFNWEAFSAIGSWLGASATFLTAIIALYPYFKRVKLYFSIYSNIETGDVLTIVNGSSNSIVIEKICFISGPFIFKNIFYEDNFLECQDDLVSDKSNFFVEPYGCKKISYDGTRIIHAMTHGDYKYAVRKCHKMRIVLQTNIGKIVGKTNIKTRDFLQHIISSSSAFKHYEVERLIKR